MTGEAAPALFAVLAAAAFALNVTLSRLGMRYSPPSTGVYWSMLTSATVLVTATLVRGTAGLQRTTVLLVVAGGLSASVVGRYSAFRGSLRLGPSRAVAVQSSTYPLVTVAGGLLLLGERLTVAQAAGIALLLLALRVVLGGAADRDEVRRTIGRERLLPYLAGLGFGVGDILRRAAVADGEDPIAAAAVGALVAAGVWVAVVARSQGLRALVRPPRGTGWFVASGAVSAVAVASSFLALSRGTASVVGPIIASQPVFVAAFSAVLLRSIESRTLRTLVGIVLVSFGAAVLARVS